MVCGLGGHGSKCLEGPAKFRAVRPNLPGIYLLHAAAEHFKFALAGAKYAPGAAAEGSDNHIAIRLLKEHHHLHMRRGFSELTQNFEEIGRASCRERV